MEKTTQKHPEGKAQPAHRALKPTAELSGMQIRLPPLEAPLLDYTPEQVMALQRQVGNQATLQRMQVPLQRAPEYQEGTSDTGKAIDPEQATGVLPFTPEGWDGRAIARTISQLNVEAPEIDTVRCVQTSFLVGLILRGPEAVSEMIDNYLRRYRQGLRQASTPENIRQWYTRSIRRLTPIPGRIADQTATFEDLSQLLTEMYDVYGSGTTRETGGSYKGPELNMLRREGYTVQDLGNTNVTQDQAAAAAATLQPGEMLACGVDASPLGTGASGHRVHIGAFPDTGGLYFYDPWPVRGDQMIELDGALNNIRAWFFNAPGEGPAPTELTFEEEVISASAPGETAPETETAKTAAEEAPAETMEMEPITITGGEAAPEEPVRRTFELVARYTPPAPTEEEVE